jgi:hypothetical protein
MSRKGSRIFGKVSKKPKTPQFTAVLEEHVPPPPPSASRSFSKMRKETIERIALEEEEHKAIVQEIEDDVNAYQAHFGFYRQQHAFGFRINRDNDGHFHVNNVEQSNQQFNAFFEQENLQFNHFLAERKNDLFFHLNSQKVGGTTDYNDDTGNFNPTDFKRKYLAMDKEFRLHARTETKEYHAFLEALKPEALEAEFLKYDIHTYSDDWMVDLHFKPKDRLIIAYIPSDAGKSTLFRNFKHYYFDLDHVLSIGKRKHGKFRFLEWFCERQKDYSYLFNFLRSEIFLNRKLLRGKILLAHSPHEIPEKLRNISVEIKLMATRPQLNTRRYLFDYASLDNYHPEIPKVFLRYTDVHFFLYNFAVALGYNPFKFR